MSAEHQPIGKPEHTSAELRPGRTASIAAPEHAALTGLGRIPHVPQAVSPDLVMMLQRAMGNAAVSRLLAPRPPRPSASLTSEDRAPIAPAGEEQAAPDTAGTHPPMVQRRLIPFAQFQQATGQARVRKTGAGGIKGAFGAKKKQIDIDQERVDILSGKTGEAALTAERTGRGLRTNINTGATSINAAYQAYEAAPSLKSLIALYDRITFWETLNAGKPWAEDLSYTLNSVKLLIEAEVRAETEAQAGGTGQEKAAPAAVLGKKGLAAPAAPMPPFLKEVGVAPGYYADHLAGKPDAVAALEDFYTNLRAGHQYNAQRAYKKVENLEGMYLIKPLFLAHFAQQANLGGLVSADTTDTGKDLTAEEIQAITIYSGGSYRTMNARLRGHDLRPETKVYGKNVRAIYGRQRMAADQTAAVEAKSGQAALMKLVTSGLDKLPRFQGIAYRVSADVPTGYFAAIRPGAFLADLAFSSASPSMTGVGNFASTQIGTSRTLYFMIHARTPAHIVGLALGASEAEVLFRPGTRFQVLAVWEHVNGKVPPNAPPQAQMVLHAQGEFKSREGDTEEQWKLRQRTRMLLGTPDEAAKAETEKFSDVAVKVKVVEIAEV